MFTQFEKDLYNNLKDKYNAGDYHVHFDIPESEDKRKELISAMDHLEKEDYVLFIDAPDVGCNYYLVELSPKGAFSEKM